MANHSARRRLARAPLVYVLTQVKFSSILGMEGFIPKIQERLRDRYPRFRHNVIQAVNINVAPSRTDQMAAPVISVAQWEFANKANNTGFLLQTDSVVFHTTTYSLFEEFIAEFQQGLEAICAELRISLLERIGLRYVDLIVPEADEDPTMYVSPGLSGFPTSSIDVQQVQHYCQTVANTEYGKLVMRYAQDKNGQALPPDLAGHDLVASHPDLEGKLKARIDTDHYCVYPGVDFSVADVVQRLQQLHGPISRAFWSTITAHAEKTWG